MELVNVIETDIEWGIAQDRWNCIFARALQREHPSATFVRVEVDTVAYTELGHRYTFDTPPELVDKVIRPLDTGKPVKPCVIVLREPTVTQAKKMTPERRAEIRTRERNKTVKQLRNRDGKGEYAERNQTRKKGRFCEETE